MLQLHSTNSHVFVFIVIQFGILWLCAWVQAKSLQSCLTLYNPMDPSLPGSSVHGILPARILEWVAIVSSKWTSLPRDQPCVSCIDRQIPYHCATWEDPHCEFFWIISFLTDIQSILFDPTFTLTHLEYLSAIIVQ